MRDIKFRGKRIDNGEWAFGHLLSVMGYSHIIPHGVGQVELDCPVDPETVGQFTGVLGWHSGDVLRNKLTGLIVVIRLGEYSGRTGYGIGFYLATTRPEEMYVPFSKSCDDQYEKIGNIHDNPELLEETK